MSEHDVDAEYYRAYQEKYGKGPFLTADALVRHHGRILLVVRGRAPGKGLLAIPGGFVNMDERIADAAVRELVEETQIRGLGFSLTDYITGHLLADDPYRSRRGRVVSNAFLFDIPDDLELTEPIGADDAMQAGWYDFEFLDSQMFFEDHYQIISDLLSD